MEDITSILSKIHKLSPSFQTAKEFISENLMDLTETEAIECISELCKFLKFKEEDQKELMDFYKIRNRVKEIMSGDPIAFILNVISRYHVGDEKTAEGLLISIANQSCLNSAGIQVALNGMSGSGKSHLVKIVIRLVPAKYVLNSGLSPKAAYYMDLQPGVIVFSDDINMSPEMEEIIKRATTNFQEETVYNTVHNGSGKKLVIPARINWYLTSVESEASKEVLNRQLTFSTVEENDHKDEIFKKQQEVAVKGICEMTVKDEDIHVCKIIFYRIKKNEVHVRIPFADRIKMANHSDPRIFPLFLDMIKGYTILFQAQREVDENGFLLATEEDFDKAKVLFQSQIKNVVTKLNDREIKILDFIYKSHDCDLNQIASGTRMSYQTVRNIIKGRPDRHNVGLLSKVEGVTMEKQSIGDGSFKYFSEKFNVLLKTWGDRPDFAILLP